MVGRRQVTVSCTSEEEKIHCFDGSIKDFKRKKLPLALLVTSASVCRGLQLGAPPAVGAGS